MLPTLVVLLGAATIAVPLTRRFGLGSVLGYLLAGVAIGPSGLGLVSDVEQIADIASLGVVMLLFLIGLELRPRRLWVMRRAVFALGSAQVVLSAAVLAGLCWTIGGAAGGGGGAGGRAGDVFHRDRAADAGGAGPAEKPSGAGWVRGAAVPGSGVHSAGGAGAAAGGADAAGSCAVARRGAGGGRGGGDPGRRAVRDPAADPDARRRADRGRSSPRRRC